jgi:hypothetical protein
MIQLTDQLRCSSPAVVDLFQFMNGIQGSGPMGFQAGIGGSGPGDHQLAIFLLMARILETLSDITAMHQARQRQNLFLAISFSLRLFFMSSTLMAEMNITDS